MNIDEITQFTRMLIVLKNRPITQYSSNCQFILFIMTSMCTNLYL